MKTINDYVLTDSGFMYWPKCPIKSCQNRACLSLNSKYCWPHTGSGKSLNEIIDSYKIKEVL